KNPGLKWCNGRREKTPVQYIEDDPRRFGVWRLPAVPSEFCGGRETRTRKRILSAEGRRYTTTAPTDPRGPSSRVLARAACRWAVMREWGFLVAILALGCHATRIFAAAEDL
ncbi:unnamed protein product, partial [Laminaria digitata]